MRKIHCKNVIRKTGTQVGVISAKESSRRHSMCHRVKDIFIILQSTVAYKQNDFPVKLWSKMSNDEIRSERESRVDKVRKAREVLSELTENVEEQACQAFTLLDTDGDGLIDLPTLEDLLVRWGRVPLDEELIDIMFYSGEGATETGMNFDGFRRYLMAEMDDTSDEEELRRAFQVFDSDPPTGRVNLTELRHYLKKTGMRLTDDEIDFLFREEDYWMLDEKNFFEYEELINKILDKPTCKSKFLNC